MNIQPASVSAEQVLHEAPPGYVRTLEIIWWQSYSGIEGESYALLQKWEAAPPNLAIEIKPPAPVWVRVPHIYPP